MKILIKCKGSTTSKLADLHPFQDDLKHMNDTSVGKFKKNLKKYGFSAPFLVWASQNGKPRDKFFILDGHQRKIALLALEKEGHEIPLEFPIVEVDASSKQEAKEKILAFISQYGKLNHGTEFFGDLGEFDKEAFQLPSDFGRFDFFKVEDSSEGTGADSHKLKTTICPDCGHEF